MTYTRMLLEKEENWTCGPGKPAKHPRIFRSRECIVQRGKQLMDTAGFALAPPSCLGTVDAFEITL